jgi:hypothetical protein
MKTEMKWAIAASLLATGVATAIVVLAAGSGPLEAFGWSIFFFSGQIPILTAARRGQLDVCTERVRRWFGRERNA